MSSAGQRRSPVDVAERLLRIQFHSGAAARDGGAARGVRRDAGDGQGLADERRKLPRADVERECRLAAAVQEADEARQSGTIGALLRREGLYSSHLVTWRRERAGGILEALTPHKRGPKSKRHPLEEENQKLRRQNELLTEELRKAEIVIDVQKKVGALLGRPMVTPDPEEKS